MKPNLKCGRYHCCSNSNSVYVCEFLHCFLKARNAQVNFSEKSQLKTKSLKKLKHGYIIYTLSLHGGSFEITLTVTYIPADFDLL